MKSVPSIVFALFLLILNSAQAQVSPYHGVVFPYDGIKYYTGNGSNAADPNGFSAVQINPAGLSLHENVRLTVAFSGKQTDERISVTESDMSYSRRTNSFIPGMLTVSLPLGHSENPPVVAVALNYIAAPEFDHYDLLKKIDRIQLTQDRSGIVWNAALGIGRRIFDHFYLGFSLTKWLGGWSWQDSSTIYGITGFGKFNYTGTHVSLGMLYQSDRVGIGLTLYSPFILMRSAETELSNWLNYTTHTIEQKYSGGARIGILYCLNHRLKMGVGYRYQGRITVTDQTDDEYFGKIVGRYDATHQFMANAEWIIPLRSFSLPIFFAYGITGMPEAQEFQPYYHYYSFNRKSKYSQRFSTGVKVRIQPFEIVLAGQWEHFASELNLINLTPPYS